MLTQGMSMVSDPTSFCKDDVLKDGGILHHRAFNPGCLHFLSIILSSKHNSFSTKHFAEYQGGICLSWESAWQPLCGLLAMLQTAPAGTKRQSADCHRCYLSQGGGSWQGRFHPA